MTIYEKNQVVRELLTTLDYHSVGERDHAERVAVYAVAIANRLEYDEDSLVRIRFGAQLHDVGKVRVDVGLLRKTGRLSPLELQSVRLHAHLAIEVINAIEFLRSSAPGIRHHHEWWDGTGYPDGLIGEDIPLDARIIGVAEAYDVLTQGTPWRRLITPDEAVEELELSSDVQFDSMVVRALNEVREVIQPLGQHP